VDSHRSVLIVISPYNRAGTLHRFVNTTGVIATMEEILGLAPLSQFDYYGRPLREIFAEELQWIEARVRGQGRATYHDANVQKGRESLSKTTDEYLMTTNWKLLAGGKVVMDQPRHVVLRDTINHLAHHRGQLTVYLRLLDRPVPAIYGPSADDQNFA